MKTKPNCECKECKCEDEPTVLEQVVDAPIRLADGAVDVTLKLLSFGMYANEPN